MEIRDVSTLSSGSTRSSSGEWISKLHLVSCSGSPVCYSWNHRGSWQGATTLS